MWLDVFAVNQHPGQQQVDDLASLQEVIKTSEKTLLVMDGTGQVSWATHNGLEVVALHGHSTACMGVHCAAWVGRAQGAVAGGRVREQGGCRALACAPGCTWHCILQHAWHAHLASHELAAAGTHMQMHCLTPHTHGSQHGSRSTQQQSSQQPARTATFRNFTGLPQDSGSSSSSDAGCHVPRATGSAVAAGRLVCWRMVTCNSPVVLACSSIRTSGGASQGAPCFS